MDPFSGEVSPSFKYISEMPDETKLNSSALAPAPTYKQGNDSEGERTTSEVTGAGAAVRTRLLPWGVGMVWT